MNKCLKAPIGLDVIAHNFTYYFGVGFSWVIQGSLRFICTLTPEYWNYMCMAPGWFFYLLINLNY